MRRLMCFFISLLFVLFMPSFRVSAAESDTLFTGDIIANDIFVGHEQEIIDFFESNIGSVDDYFFIACNRPNFSSNFAGMSLCYIKKSDFNDSYLTRDYVNDSVVTYTIYTHYFKVIDFSADGYTDGSSYRIAFDYTLSIQNVGQLRAYFNEGGSYGLIGQGFCTNLEFGFGGKLRFEINPDFTLNMTLNNLGETFTLDAINGSDNYYNYMMYISPHPASVGIHRSLSESVYIMSSKQWCMKYSWKSTAMTSDDLYDDVVDYVTDLFGKNIFDMWGNALDIAKTYYNSQGDGFNYYQLSQQDNCPFYLIKPKDTKQHVIPYSAMNIDINSDYYVNIIYLDTTAYGVAPANTSPIDFDVNNSYRDHPIYNLNLLYDYVCYAAIQFNFYEGDFTADPNSFKYDDVVDNANPNKSSATISSDDDTVDINTNNSYDNSSSVSYINYGTIYHNCTWGSSGSGSGFGSGSVPDVPMYDFEKLTDQTGSFFEFVVSIFDSVGVIPVIFVTASFAVLLYLRIWGR